MESVITNKRQITCPRCGGRQLCERATVANVTREPLLRESILDESFFAWKCEKCALEAKLVTRCLYHDEQRGFMVYLIPGFREHILLDEEIERQYPEFAQATKRVVTSVNQLKEKILIFEAGADDRAIELSKLAVAGLLVKKYKKKVQNAYFCRLNEEDNSIGFSFFFEGESEPFLYQTREQIYEYSRELLNACSDQEKNGFCMIDVKWAASFLDAMKKKEQPEHAQ